jgi:RNA polymerase sigma factor (sigma-70 family)
MTDSTTGRERREPSRPVVVYPFVAPLPTPADPQALMAQVRDGSEAALEALVGHFQGELLGFFYHLTFDQLLAEELAQDVFVKVWHARSRWVQTASVRTWLYRIAHNRWIDHLRTRRTLTSLDDGEDDRLAATLPAREDRSPGAADGMAKEITERIAAALDLLPTGQREVFVLANNHGLRYQDISEVLGIPEGTVKSRMHHAVRTLREELADLVEEDV